MLRQPAVAGYFYEGSPSSLRAQVERFLVPEASRRKALGVLVPHAGFVYSGAVAGAVYSHVELPDVFVLIGPNHTGLGAPVSIMTTGKWTTPLGSVDVNQALAESITAKSRRTQDDTLAHLREHSLEVQLPFLQMLKKEFSIVPIQMMDTRLETCVEVGNSVAAAITTCGLRCAEDEAPKVLIVASSDMSHYISAEEAKKKDIRAIRKILDLDPAGLYREIRDEDITMCGFGPAVAMLTASKALGATKAELIKYANSGDVSGDYDQVVGYAGVVVY